MIINYTAGHKLRKLRVISGIFIVVLLLPLLTGCGLVRMALNSDENVSITIIDRGQEIGGSYPADYSVRQVLAEAGISYETQDRVEPGINTIITDGMEIRITHITVEREISQEIIPFTSQTVRNQTMPEGENQIIQMGKNGLEEIATQYTYEDGVLVSQITAERQTLNESLPEIIMIGAQAKYAPIQIPGKIIYVSNGNAWMMEGTTENRTPVVTSGDMDGNILDLSSDGRWLLYSRKTTDDQINSLWMLNLSDWDAEPISMRVSNVIHYAEWLPGETRRMLYSTVVPQESAPGWSAENDLRLRVVSDTGMLISDEAIVEADHSGLYSWWGTEFHLASDGRRLAYATPGSIGIIDRLTGEKEEITPILPYEMTRSDWAWIPGTAWNADDSRLIFSYHGDISGRIQTYDPAAFNIGTADPESKETSGLISETGLFSYPAPSPQFSNGESFIAYLQSLDPLQSDSSRYRIMITDSDGGDSNIVYPLNSDGYVSPQMIKWAPATEKADAWISLVEQGNLWLVNPFTGIYNQITIDQSVSSFIWE